VAPHPYVEPILSQSSTKSTTGCHIWRRQSSKNCRGPTWTAVRRLRRIRYARSDEQNLQILPKNEATQSHEKLKPGTRYHRSARLAWGGTGLCDKRPRKKNRIARYGSARREVSRITTSGRQPLSLERLPSHSARPSAVDPIQVRMSHLQRPTIDECFTFVVSVLTT